MSHLCNMHPKKYAEIKQKIEEEKRKSAKRTCNVDRAEQAMLSTMSKKKTKLETSSRRHKRIAEKIAGVLIHDFQPFSFGRG